MSMNPKGEKIGNIWFGGHKGISKGWTRDCLISFLPFSTWREQWPRAVISAEVKRMKGLHHLPQDCISNGRRVKTKLQQIDTINVKNVQDMIHVPSPWILKGKTGNMWFGGHKGIASGTPWSGLELDTWLGVLNLTSQGSESQLQYYDSLLIHASITIIKAQPQNPGI